MSDFLPLEHGTPHRVRELGYDVEVVTWGYAEEQRGDGWQSGRRTASWEFRNSTVFGFVAAGERAALGTDGMTFGIREGCYFACSRPGVVMGGRGLLIIAHNYSAPLAVGGPIEREGRLAYIDGCTDSLLLPPVKLGDPCLNHLHFPPGIDQTEHTHPSVRLGITARGRGECIVPGEPPIPLEPGRLWCIPTNGRHKFRTLDSELDVIAFHPDSDYGPQDEEHPMLNRTIVGGQSARLRPELPIYDWRDEDVWTAPQRFGWDYNRAYDVMLRAGVSRSNQRVAPPYGEQPMANLPIYAACWPELWEKMLHRVPGAQAAGRYAVSPLYSYRQLEDWDATANPQALIQRALEKWPEDKRAALRAQIEKFALMHARKSRDPIPMEGGSDSGITWKLLYKIALRGDSKGRYAQEGMAREQAAMKKKREKGERGAET